MFDTRASSKKKKKIRKTYARLLAVFRFERKTDRVYCAAATIGPVESRSAKQRETNASCADDTRRVRIRNDSRFLARTPTVCVTVVYCRKRLL